MRKLNLELISKLREKVIIEWVWILSCYILSPDQKYLPGLANSRPLIQEQLFYGQSISPCKLSRLNGEYRYLQLLLSLCIYPSYIFACVCQEIKSKGGEPLTF